MGKSEGPLTRRDFIVKSSITMGGLLLTACVGRRRLRETEVPGLTQGTFADTVLVNGNIITVDRTDTIVQALAIKDGLILQTGANDLIRGLAGPQTKTIDLHGKTVTPGLIDAHNHLQVWGVLSNNYVPFLPPEVRTKTDLLSKLSRVISETKPGEWIQGYFWNIEPLPTASDLDPIAPNNPVFIMQQGGHYGSANSLALAKGNIDKNTPTPQGGIIERDKDGNPTGIFYNHRAMDLVRKNAPQPTASATLDSLKLSENMMAECGVTTFHDNNARMGAIQMYAQAVREKRMMLNGKIFYTLEWPSDVNRALNEIEHFSDEHIQFAGYKFLIDGQFPTWYTYKPHPGISWNMPTWQPDAFKKAVKSMHDTGLQICVHCGGDASFDLALDAFEAAMNANPLSNTRHRIEHGMLCTKEAVRRAADLGIVISAQPQFIHGSKYFPEKLGDDRAARIIVTREWLDAGIKLALGSDTPTSPWVKPQITLAATVERTDANDKPYHQEQALTIKEALRAHTMGSAYAAFEEKIKGSLEAGKLADIAIWSDDIYSIQPRDIVKTKIEMTMIKGKIVYQA